MPVLGAGLLVMPLLMVTERQKVTLTRWLGILRLQSQANRLFLHRPAKNVIRSEIKQQTVAGQAHKGIGKPEVRAGPQRVASYMVGSNLLLTCEDSATSSVWLSKALCYSQRLFLTILEDNLLSEQAVARY